jgi:hypothetical protein
MTCSLVCVGDGQGRPLLTLPLLTPAPAHPGPCLGPCTPAPADPSPPQLRCLLAGSLLAAAALADKGPSPSQAYGAAPYQPQVRAVQCSAVQCSAVQYSAVQCSAVQWIPR